MTEQTVYVFSNASTIQHPDNTLTKFVNELPETLNIPKNENWYICAESVGFANNFSTVMLPENESLPCIRIYSFSNEIIDFVSDVELRGTVQGSTPGPNLKTSDSFGYHHYDYNTQENIFKDMLLEADIFFPSGNISVEDIRNSLKIINDKNIKIDCEAVLNHPMVFYLREDSEKFYCLLFHENTVKTFGFSSTKICGITNIKDEKYYLIRLDNENVEICGDLKRWHKKFPEIIKIRCDEIEEQILNSKLTKDLVSFCPKMDEEMKYIFYEFQTRQYVKISNTILSKLSISFIDEYNLQIPLSKGVASFVKLNIKKMPLDYDRFNIRISSDTSKTNNNEESSSIFSTNMPYPYYLDPSWNVSLTSISFPSNFRPLPAEKKLRRIFTSKISNENMKMEIKDFYIPNKQYNKGGLILMLNEALKHIDSSFSLLAESINQDVNKKNDQNCYLMLKKKSFLMISHPIADILGFDISKASISNYNYVVVKGDSISFVNPTEHDVVIRMMKLMDVNILKPNYMMIYMDIIKPIIVGNTYSKLLRVVPYQHSENCDYNVQDFRHRENHPLENTLLKTIHVEIRSHTGELINFAEGKHIHMNLLFSRDI